MTTYVGIYVVGIYTKYIAVWIIASIFLMKSHNNISSSVMYVHLFQLFYSNKIFDKYICVSVCAI